MAMTLYDFKPTANAQRARVFQAEKALVIPTEQLNEREDNQLDEPLSWSWTTARQFPNLLQSAVTWRNCARTPARIWRSSSK